MGIGGQCLRAHPRQVLLEARLPGQVPTQHQHVHEVADQPLQLRSTAAGNRHPDRHIVLPAVAIQEHLERCEQRHEQCGALASAELLQPAREILSKLESEAPAPVALHRRRWPIGGQLQHRQVRQRLLPVGKLLRQRVPLQPFPLPHCIVRVLHRQLRQRRGPSLTECLVQHRELPPYYP